MYRKVCGYRVGVSKQVGLVYQCAILGDIDQLFVFTQLVNTYAHGFGWSLELNEILLDPEIRMKRINGVKKIHKLKCYNHVTRKMRQWCHKDKNRNNKLKTKESMVDLKIKVNNTEIPLWKL